MVSPIESETIFFFFNYLLNNLLKGVPEGVDSEEAKPEDGLSGEFV